MSKETKHSELRIEKWGEDEDKRIRCINEEDEATKPLSNFQTTPVGASIIYSKDKEARWSHRIPCGLIQVALLQKDFSPNSVNSTYFPNVPNGTFLTLTEYQK